MGEPLTDPQDQVFSRLLFSSLALALGLVAAPDLEAHVQAWVRRQALDADLDRWSRWVHRLEAPVSVVVTPQAVQVRSWRGRETRWAWHSTLEPVTAWSEDLSPPSMCAVLCEALLETGDLLVSLEARARDGRYAVPRRFAARHPPSWMGGVLVELRVETPACEGVDQALAFALNLGFTQAAFQTADGWRLRGTLPLREEECADLLP